LQPESEVAQRGNPDFLKKEVQTSQNRKSRLPQTKSADFRKEDTNYTNNNQTDYSDIEHQSIHHDPLISEIDMDMMSKMSIYREIIRDNIAYSHLRTQHRFKADIINELVELMVEMVCSTKKTIRISGDEVTVALFKSKFLKIDSDHIEYILECLDSNTSDIHNIKSYLPTTLYNAPNTISNYYRAAVSHDMRE
jgi:hypothetical protein